MYAFEKTTLSHSLVKLDLGRGRPSPLSPASVHKILGTSWTFCKNISSQTSMWIFSMTRFCLLLVSLMEFVISCLFFVCVNSCPWSNSSPSRFFFSSAHSHLEFVSCPKWTNKCVYFLFPIPSAMLFLTLCRYDFVNCTILLLFKASLFTFPSNLGYWQHIHLISVLAKEFFTSSVLFCFVLFCFVNTNAPDPKVPC